ncbi:MAG: ATP-binding cassette domain-containing protein [Caulobacter sp.]|nr:ATP-binding cassette domain-containing protein [Caulobacter sp.]
MFNLISLEGAQRVGFNLVGMLVAIEFRAVSKTFRGKHALRPITATVPIGSVYGFLGNNGAGKTTTIKLVLGLLKPTAGEVALWGKNPAKDRQVLRRVGCLLDAPGLYDRLTGRENLEVARLAKGLARSEVDRVLAAVSMTKHSSKLAGNCSSGMRQRLALARSMLGSPDLLILDEPTNALDPEGIAEVRETLRELPKTVGATVFLSSHDLTEVEQIATHIGILHDGRLRATGAIGEFAQESTRIVVDVHQASDAESHLVGANFAVRVTGPSRLEVTVPSGADPRVASFRVNQVLMARGLEVFGLATVGASLAEIFERLTSGTSE